MFHWKRLHHQAILNTSSQWVLATLFPSIFRKSPGYCIIRITGNSHRPVLSENAALSLSSGWISTSQHQLFKSKIEYYIAPANLEYRRLWAQGCYLFSWIRSSSYNPRKTSGAIFLRDQDYRRLPRTIWRFNVFVGSSCHLSKGYWSFVFHSLLLLFC